MAPNYNSFSTNDPPSFPSFGLAWLMIKGMLFLICVMAIIVSILAGTFFLVRCMWLYSPFYYREARKWYAARKGRRVGWAEQTELEPLEGGGDGEGEEWDGDRDTLCDGGEEGKVVI